MLYQQITIALLIVLVCFLILNILHSPFTSLFSSTSNYPTPALYLPPMEEADINITAYNEIMLKTRSNIEDELTGYPFDENATTTDQLLMNKGGNPVRALIVTTWRSGSTFLGDLLTSHPATFYHSEPLSHYLVKQIRDQDMDAPHAIQLLSKLLHCDYKQLDPYLHFSALHRWVYKFNRRLYVHCDEGRQPLCWHPKFLSAFCRLFPYQAMKTVRIRLSMVRSLMLDQSLNLHVAYLVRDPRGTMQSRRHRSWCPGSPDCDQPDRLCQDLLQDYRAAKLMAEEFPGRFSVVRYEDFSGSPANSSTALLPRLGFQPAHPSIASYLASHTGADKGGVSSTFRDSQTAPYHWKGELDFQEVLDIQDVCADAMDAWGYRAYRAQEEVAKMDSVLARMF